MTGLKVKKIIITFTGANVLVHWPGQIGPILLPWIFPNLGLRCTNIPAQYPMLVLQRPCHTSERRRSNDIPGGTILTPNLKPKCSGCNGLPIEIPLTIEHVYQCAAFQSLVACTSGWEAMAQRGNRCSCKKNEQIFLCQTASSNWVLGAFWVYYKMDILKLITKSGFRFFKLLRAPRSLFLDYKLGLKNGWKDPLKTILVKQKNQSCFNKFSAFIL